MIRKSKSPLYNQLGFFNINGWAASERVVVQRASLTACVPALPALPARRTT